MDLATSLKRHQATARKVRAGWLAGVAAGVFTVDEFVEYAAKVDGKCLRVTKLATLLAAQPGWTHPRARAAIAGLRMYTDEPARDLTVRWLLDGRAAGRHLFWALVRTRPRTLADGFPWKRGR